MAIEERPTSGGNGFLYFVVGALVIGVAVLAWYLMSGQTSTTDNSLDRVADSVSEAADSISDSAEDAARNVTPPAPQPAPTPQ